RIARPHARPEIASAPSVTRAALQPPAVGITAPAAASAAAAVVLARAEQARAQRRFADATRLYDDLAARFPGSREEIVARVLHGQLLLDEMHDAPSALRWFERYLAREPGGALAEEARLGRAQALQLRGSRDGERAAWEELLRKHPASVHAGADSAGGAKQERLSLQLAADGSVVEALRAHLAPDLGARHVDLDVTLVTAVDIERVLATAGDRNADAPLARAWLDGRDPQAAILF